MFLSSENKGKVTHIWYLMAVERNWLKAFADHGFGCWRLNGGRYAQFLGFCLSFDFDLPLHHCFAGQLIFLPVTLPRVVLRACELIEVDGQDTESIDYCDPRNIDKYREAKQEQGEQN